MIKKFNHAAIQAELTIERGIDMTDAQFIRTCESFIDHLSCVLAKATNWELGEVHLIERTEENKERLRRIQGTGI